MHVLRHAALFVFLVAALIPCRAEDFTDETWSALFLTSLLADRVQGVCSEVDPTLGGAIAASLARLREVHARDLLAGRAIAQRKAAPEDLESVGKALAERFTRALQKETDEARHARCTRLVVQLESSARRSRRELVEATFRNWFAQQQRERQIDCARLDGVARSLARRLLSKDSAEAETDQLRADAKMAARAADWCLQAQAAAAREGIGVPGNFGLIGDTARAISDAAAPMLSGGDPAAARARGVDRARRYLAEPDWL
ncbi:hypothetical protein GCM10028796_09590 [Ramlibacter monticola]|uniref:Secreted protein n=1 Tax=Ramlibacter monticola TaxID=1926872 RepID=A0A936YXL2_9BURK|nr:hypothetical protein [Ramlibacter monticola]MBL0389815.1 hypothetical protein [Ramlibacter monticola]